MNIENIFSSCCIQGRRLFGKYWSDTFWVVDPCELLGFVCAVRDKRIIVFVVLCGKKEAD